MDPLVPEKTSEDGGEDDDSTLSEDPKFEEDLKQFSLRLQA